eukprot:351012-Chlamydomonas_euryale.AAC.6
MAAVWHAAGPPTAGTPGAVSLAAVPPATAPPQAASSRAAHRTAPCTFPDPGPPARTNNHEKRHSMKRDVMFPALALAFKFDVCEC